MASHPSPVCLSTLLHTKDSAPGPDGIPYSAWRVLPEMTLQAMSSYFYDIQEETALPPTQVGVWIPKAKMGPKADHFRPLGMHQNDGHFLSMVTSLVLAILTGRTDLCVSGVFGAGKTRAAAALIAGLMIMDPSLNLMVTTKENTAAKAFADHLLSLQLPASVYGRAGRIVGFIETKKGASHKTVLDIEQEKRNDVLRQKKLLIGCGRGFQQESQQRYSPVRAWISTVHLALLDEAQQYGNIDELMTLARSPAHCLLLWCGDHKQTPGGLRNTTEAKMFRRKLLSRPLGLRCDTEYVQPHLLGSVVARFMTGSTVFFSHAVRAMTAPTVVRS